MLHYDNINSNALTTLLTLSPQYGVYISVILSSQNVCAEEKSLRH